METFYLPATKLSPEINLNPNTGLLTFKGRSTHENPVVFYEPIIQWLQEYSKQPAPQTTLHIYIDYFNTASSKCLLDILKKTQHIIETGNSAIVKWEYETGDDAMHEAGQDFSEILKFPFQFIESN